MLYVLTSRTSGKSLAERNQLILILEISRDCCVVKNLYCF